MRKSFEDEQVDARELLHEIAAGAGSNQVLVDNFSFAPAMTAVAAGATVTWTNRDDVPHNIVSTNQKFKSPVLDTDEQFSHTFDARLARTSTSARFIER